LINGQVQIVLLLKKFFEIDGLPENPLKGEKQLKRVKYRNALKTSDVTLVSFITN